MRNISFSLTTPQFLDGTKDVTRRMGWTFLKVGDELCVIEKGQGLKKGEKVKRIGVIRVTDVRVERLDRIIYEEVYGADEVRREGFGHSLTRRGFVHFFCKHHIGCVQSSEITRIEFVKIRETRSKLRPEEM
jgi:hypothetical protein